MCTGGGGTYRGRVSEDTSSQEKRGDGGNVWLPIGAGVGLTFGAAMDSIPQGLALGVAVGLILSAVSGRHHWLSRRARPDGPAEGPTTPG